MEGGDGTPPRLFLGHPPPLSASRFPCHGACHAACHGTGTPSDSYLGGRQPDGGPDREAVNRPSRRRLGGVPSGSCCNNSRRSAALSNPPAARKSLRLPAVIAFSSRAISWRMSGSALVGPAGPAAPWPSPSWVQLFRTGAAHRGAWARPHARSSLSVDCPASTYTNVAAYSSTAIGNLKAKYRGIFRRPSGPYKRYGKVPRSMPSASNRCTLSASVGSQARVGRSTM